jgi:outer membrane protein TolC
MKRFRVVLTTLTILTSMAGAATSYAAEPLLWAEAVHETLLNHPGLASARGSVQSEQADRTTAASVFWPQVTGDASGSTSETRTAGSRASDRFSYGISGRQLLFDGFKSVYDVENAVDAVEAAGYGYRVTSSNVRLSLRRAYIDLWRAQELIRITRQIAGRRQQSYDLIQLRYEAGREHRGSLLTAEANLDQARFEIERAERGLVVAQRALLRELGRTEFETVRVPEQEDPPAPDRTRPDFEAIAAETPLLQQLLVQKEAARWGVKSAAAELAPAVYATAATGRSGTEWPPSTSDWSAGVSASVTFFDGWAQWANIARAEAARRSMEADARGGRDGILVTLESAWAGWLNAAASAKVQAKFLEAARERSRIAEAEYGTGLITFNDWIIIENNLVQADKSYLDARTDAWIAEAQWRQAKGDTLDDEQV